MSKPVGFGRPDVHASGAVVVKLPDQAEVKRFACFCKKPDNQHDTKLEFYAGALDQEKPVDVFELGLDFVMKLDKKTNSFQVTRKADKAQCTVTFYKAPSTKDVAALLAQFVDKMQFCADNMKEVSVPSLNVDLDTDEPTLGVQMKGGAKKKKDGGAENGAAAAANGAAAGGSGKKPALEQTDALGLKEEVTEVSPGLFEIVKHVDRKPAGRVIMWRNDLKDKMFTITYKFKEPGGPTELIYAAGAKKVGEAEYQWKAYPLQVVEGARGKWNGEVRTVEKKSPDKEWRQQEARRLEVVLEQDLAQVKALVKKSGKKKVTANDIAAMCAQERFTFVDLTFPPGDGSLMLPHEKGVKKAPWRKPQQWLGAEASSHLFVGRIQPEDIDQGSLGDCYLLSAISCLAEFPHLIYSIFDESQDERLGLFRVSLCKHGWWQNVVLDHYVPADFDGPIFAKNKEEPMELWAAMCEKAYAKIHGSYGAIRSGSGGQALADFTGCPYEIFDGDEMTEELYANLLANDAVDYIQMVSTPGKDTADYAGGKGKDTNASLTDKYKKVGLACGHAYSLIACKEYKGNKLCKIRNPWGNSKEWNGDWSDGDTKNWTADAKKACEMTDEDDGTFWMAWKDVRKWFDSASCCYVNQWDQYRMAAAVEKGTADLAMKVECKEDTEAWVGVQQQDTRGMAPDTKAQMKYTHLAPHVVEDKAGAVTDVVTPPCKNGRDHYKQVKFEKGKTYWVFARCSKEDMNRHFTYAILPEVPTALAITFHAPKAGAVSYKDTFKPENWEACEALYQVKGIFSTNGRVVERAGNGVDTSNAKRVLTAAERKCHKRAGGKGLGAYASIPLEITAVQGKSLPVMDADGSCDPYLEIKLKAQDAKGKIVHQHPRPQTQYTQCIENSLNPKWNSKHEFSCTGDDVIFVTCFDRDTKGKDYMGEFQVPLTDLDIAEGKSVTKSYKLRGDVDHGGSARKRGAATGEIELTIKVM